MTAKIPRRNTMPTATQKSTPRPGSRGLFLTFEGIEGSGKSSQCRTVAQWLRRLGHSVLETREPGGTPIAEQLRNALLAREQEPMTPWAEAMIVLASRSQHVAQVIQPALAQGMIVLCDRYADSTMAYQGYGRGLDRTLLTAMNRAASQQLTPHLTLLLDVPVEVGLQRRHHNHLEINRIDAESFRFHERVRRGFRALAKQHPRRIRLIDGHRAPELIALDIEQAVSRLLNARAARPAKRSTKRPAKPRRRT